jgi:hypothetical protein
MLAAAGILIVSCSHISLLILSATKWKRQADVYRGYDEVACQNKKSAPAQDDSIGTAADLSALINAIKAEGQANRDEERAEDDAGKLREWLTIALIAMTLIAIGWQVIEMIKVYDPISEQAKGINAQLKEMQTSSRAWVGSIGAQVKGKPSIGNDLAITIQYQNLGREPARNFNNSAINGPPYSVANTSFASGFFNEAFTDSAQACLLLPDANGGQIVYPSSGAIGGASYTEHLILDKSLITKEAVAGDVTIVIEGCFTYYTAKAVRHSAFCYTWNAKTNDPDHPDLNFCPTGNDGD